MFRLSENLRGKWVFYIQKEGLTFGLLLLSFWFFLGGCDQAGKSKKTEEISEQKVARATIGYPAPDFTLLDIDGKSFNLSQEKGKIVLVNFWATWCTPCRVEMPSIEALYHRFDRNEFEIFTVSSDVQGAAVVKPFIQSYRLTFPALIDENFMVTNLYKVRALPATYIIDQEGIITHRFFGAKNWNNKESTDLIRKMIQSG